AHPASTPVLQLRSRALPPFPTRRSSDLDPNCEKRAIEIVSKRLEEEETHLVDRALLAMLYAYRKEADEARRVLEPLVSKEKKDAQDVEAIWSIASELTYRVEAPELACELLESVERKQLSEQRGSEFEYSALALLAEA